MPAFNYRNGFYHVEDLDLRDLAEQFGTPAFIYSEAFIRAAYQRYQNAFTGLSHAICYAVKANSNLTILNLLASMGAGFDIVSGGELTRVITAGGDPKKIVFSGVGKLDQEISAALKAGIHCFNVESEAELAKIEMIASTLGLVAPISFRVNPDVDPKTHPYISTGLKQSKFGIAADHALPLYQKAAQSEALNIIGIDCHVGSQITEIGPFKEALQKLLELVDRLQQNGIHLEHIDMGGGMGVQYKNEPDINITDLAETIKEQMSGRSEKIILEPGRSLLANAGILLTEVIYLKENGGQHFAVIDSAMNDLVRPALYDAWHNVLPVIQFPEQRQEQSYEIVGPICETGDFLAKQRRLKIQPGDLLSIESAGAYGSTMSSNYNSRGRAAEILVSGKQVREIRRRESIENQMAMESTETFWPEQKN
jgi:diaminopimelate decarboxylase